MYLYPHIYVRYILHWRISSPRMSPTGWEFKECSFSSGILSEIGGSRCFLSFICSVVYCIRRWYFSTPEKYEHYNLNIFVNISNFYYNFQWKFLCSVTFVAGQINGCAVFPRSCSTHQTREYGFMLYRKKKYDRISVQLFYADSWKVWEHS